MTQPSPRAGGRRTAILGPVLTTLGVQVLATASVAAMPVLAPAAAPELGLSPAAVGVFIALVYVGSMAGSLVCGELVLRLGAIRVSQLGLGLCALGLAATAIGPLPAMALAALLIGFGHGPITPASSHVLARNTPASMFAFMFSVKQTGVPLGGALAGAVVPALVLLGGWRWALLAVAAACAGAAVAAQVSRSALDQDRMPGRPLSLAGALSPLRLVLREPPLRELAVSSFFFGAMQLSLSTFLVAYLTTAFGMSLVQAGLTLAAAQIAGVVGRLALGFVADRGVPARRLLGLLALAMAFAAMATAAFDRDWPYAAVLAVVVLFGATALGWNGVYLAEVARMAPAGMASSATGGTLFFTFLGIVIGPPLFAACVAVTGSYGISYALMALPVLARGIGLLRDRTGRKPG